MTVRCTWATIAFVCSTLVLAQQKWEKIIDEDGVEVFRREHKGSDILELRAQALVKAPMTKMMAVLQDISIMPQWVEGCNEASELERNFDVNSFDRNASELYQILYGRIGILWPISDRDFVLRTRTVLHKKTSAVRLDIFRVEDSRKPPVDGVVRMPAMRTTFTMIPRNEDRHTWVQLYVHADPGGWFPAWAVNFISKGVPLKTIRNMRKILATKYYDKGYQKLFNHYLKKLRRQQR